jgi:DNA-binding IclR family transcriptional regulator
MMSKINPRKTLESRGPDDTLKSLTKIVRILECFSTTYPTLSAIEVGKRTGYPRSTTHRLLVSLKEAGFLDQDRQRDRYRLGLKLFEFGNIVLSNMDLHREAKPYAEQLGHITGEQVNLAVFNGQHAVIVRRFSPSQNATLPTFVGTAPLHCTAIGKTILAFQSPRLIEKLIKTGLERYTEATLTDKSRLREELRMVRERGYAINEGEYRSELRCIGAPIRDRNDCVFAAISTSGPLIKLANKEITARAHIVTHTADAISAKLWHLITRR